MVLHFKKRVVIVCGIATVLVVLPTSLRYVSTYLHLAAFAQAIPVNGKPFTLTYEEILRSGPYPNSPLLRLSRGSVIAQRSDGARSVTTVYFPYTQSEYTKREIVMPDFTQIHAWDSIGLKTTGIPAPERKRQARLGRRAVPESGCEYSYNGRPVNRTFQRVGEVSQNGLRASKFVTGSGASRTIEVWLAPDLACEEVYMFAVFNEPGNVHSNQRYLTGRMDGEPDPALFDVSKLREGSPMETRTTQMRKAGYPESFIQEQMNRLKSAEQSYRKHTASRQAP